MQHVLIRLIFILLLFAAIIFLQIFLSRRQSKWPGLVLPILSFLFGLLYPLNMVAPISGLDAGFFLGMIVVWLLGNIPTFIYLVIYFVCREKYRKNDQLNKMNIQDLDF